MFHPHTLVSPSCCPPSLSSPLMLPPHLSFLLNHVNITINTIRTEVVIKLTSFLISPLNSFPLTSPSPLTPPFYLLPLKPPHPPQADLARPPAPTYKQDLSDLFDYKYCTDVDLVFQGAVFPVHRAILSCRCPYFQVSLES